MKCTPYSRHYRVYIISLKLDFDLIIWVVFYLSYFNHRHVVKNDDTCLNQVMYYSKGVKQWKKCVFFSLDGASVVYSNCPTEYIEVISSMVRTCLRLELMAKNYSDAALGCQRDGGGFNPNGLCWEVYHISAIFCRWVIIYYAILL